MRYTLCTFFFFFQVVTDYTRSLLTLYIKCFLSPFSNCAGILSSASLSQYHSRRIIINVSRSKCEYFVFSVFDMELCTFSWSVYCWSHGMDGWHVHSLFCKTMSVSSSERYIYYVSLLNNWSNMSFETEVFLYTSKPVVAVYTVSCITPFFP